MKNKWILSGFLIIILTSTISCKPEPLEITTWYPREVIAQGNLVSVSLAGDADTPQWLIGLELMSAKTNKYETFIYHLKGEFDVGSTNIEGYPSDVLGFKLGQYYLLYRKVGFTKIRYYLSPD